MSESTPKSSSTKVVVKKPAPASDENPTPVKVVKSNVVESIPSSGGGVSEMMEEPKPVPIKPPEAPSIPTPPPLSRDALTVSSMLTEYHQLLSPTIVTKNAINQSMQIMARICEVLCDSKHDDARDVMWQFHIDHQNTLMREDLGLRGIRTLLGKKGLRVLTVYSLYRHKVTKTGLLQDLDKARPYTSQAFVLYISGKR